MTKRTRRSGPPRWSSSAMRLASAPRSTGVEVHLSPREAGQPQQVVDERRHLLAGGLDSLGVTPADLAEAVPAVFQQGRGETAQRPQRSAQVVSDRIRERLQVPDGPLQVVLPALPLGHIADGRRDQGPLVSVGDPQRDLRGEDTAVAPAPGQLHPGAASAGAPDRPCSRSGADGRTARAASGTSISTSWPSSSSARVPEQPHQLGIDQDDPAVGVHADHRIRGRGQERDGPVIVG